VSDELDQDEKIDLIKILVKEIEVSIGKKAKSGEIKIALWTEFPKGLLSTYKIGSSSCRVGLPSSVLNSNFFTAEFPLNLGQRRHKINTKRIKKRISCFDLALKYQKMVNDPVSDQGQLWPDTWASLVPG